MIIACVIHSLDGGGAERVMAGLASRLATQGHQVTLITLDDGRRDRHPVGAEVRRICMDVMGVSGSPLAAVRNNAHRLLRLRQTLRDVAPQVVLSFCDRTNVLVLAATRGTDLPVVVAERSDPRYQPLPWAWRQARPLLYRRAAALVALTAPVAAVMSRWNRHSAAVIPSAVDPPPPPAAADVLPDNLIPLSSDRQRIVAVGRLAVEKGHDRLINAFAAVADHRPDWDLLIAGEGPERASLEAQVLRCGLAGRVRFCGWVQPIWPLLQAADLFALTSRHEGFPSALLEAMAAGVTPLAVDCESGPRAIIRHDVDGWLVAARPEDPAGLQSALATALNRLTADAALRQRLGSAATAVVHRFGWPAMVEAYERLLQQVAKPPPAVK